MAIRAFLLVSVLLLAACGSSNLENAQGTEAFKTLVSANMQIMAASANALDQTSVASTPLTETLMPTETATQLPTEAYTLTFIPSPTRTSTATFLPTWTLAPVDNSQTRDGNSGGGSTGGCDDSYPDFCIPPPPPDRNCGDIDEKDFTVDGDDPHGFDGDHDGIGCES